MNSFEQVVFAYKSSTVLKKKKKKTIYRTLFWRAVLELGWQLFTLHAAAQSALGCFQGCCCSLQSGWKLIPTTREEQIEEHWMSRSLLIGTISVLITSSVTLSGFTASFGLHLLVQVPCCFTYTETIRTIRDMEPRTATSTFTQLLSSVFGKVQVQCFFTYTETIRTIRDMEPRTASSTFTQLLSSVFGKVQVQCFCTSTETILLMTIGDREPRMATSTFTQLLSSGVCYVAVDLI